MIRFWLQLSLTEGIGPILAQRLVDAAGSIEAACSANALLLKSVEGIGSAKSRNILESLKRAADEADGEIARAEKAGARLICRDDEEYPTLLRSIPDPPLVLYVKGAIEPRDLHSIAIVGSRRCSFYGREQSERFAALLAGAGMTVISGGARGIDSAAHRGALTHPHGRTIAVLGSGIDVPYPAENAALFNKIAENGAIISEYPVGSAPVPENFPRRNRIVSGMARGVLVVESDERSGALITARMACDDHGRSVFAIPGRVDNAMSAGPHLLIRQGATLVAKLEDVIDNLGPLPQEATEPSSDTGILPVQTNIESPAPPQLPINISDSQQRLLSHFDGEPLNVDAIAERSGLAVNVILQDLTFLTLKGLVKRIDGQTFAKRTEKIR
jgi:DNA processing protein